MKYAREYFPYKMGDLEATIKSKFCIEGVPWRPPETLSFCSKSMVWRDDIVFYFLVWARRTVILQRFLFFLISQVC